MSRADAGRSGRSRSAPATRRPGGSRRSPGEAESRSPGEAESRSPGEAESEAGRVRGTAAEPDGLGETSSARAAGGDEPPGNAAGGDVARGDAVAEPSGNAAGGDVARGDVARGDAVAEPSGDPAGGSPGGEAAGHQTPRRPPWAGWDSVIRVAGLVVAIVAAFLSGALEILLSTLRAGDFTTVWHGDAIGSGRGPLIPVSILLAIVLNYAIAWFAVSTTGRRWALGPPWALWTLMMFAASGVRTSEGDYLLAGENWVALVMILAGSLSFAVYSYRMILKRGRP